MLEDILDIMEASGCAAFPYDSEPWKVAFHAVYDSVLNTYKIPTATNRYTRFRERIVEIWKRLEELGPGDDKDNSGRQLAPSKAVRALAIKQLKVFRKAGGIVSSFTSREATRINEKAKDNLEVIAVDDPVAEDVEEEEPPPADWEEELVEEGVDCAVDPFADTAADGETSSPTENGDDSMLMLDPIARSFLSESGVETYKDLLKTSTRVVVDELMAWRRRKAIKPWKYSTAQVNVHIWKRVAAKQEASGRELAIIADTTRGIPRGSSASGGRASYRSQIPDKNVKLTGVLTDPTAMAFLADIGISTSTQLFERSGTELAKEFVQWRRGKSFSEIVISDAKQYVYSWRRCVSMHGQKAKAERTELAPDSKAIGESNQRHPQTMQHPVTTRGSNIDPRLRALSWAPPYPGITQRQYPGMAQEQYPGMRQEQYAGTGRAQEQYPGTGRAQEQYPGTSRAQVVDPRMVALAIAQRQTSWMSQAFGPYSLSSKAPTPIPNLLGTSGPPGFTPVPRLHDDEVYAQDAHQASATPRHPQQDGDESSSRDDSDSETEESNESSSTNQAGREMASKALLSKASREVAMKDSDTASEFSKPTAASERGSSTRPKAPAGTSDALRDPPFLNDDSPDNYVTAAETLDSSSMEFLFEQGITSVSVFCGTPIEELSHAFIHWRRQKGMEPMSVAFIERQMQLLKLFVSNQKIAGQGPKPPESNRDKAPSVYNDTDLMREALTARAPVNVAHPLNRSWDAEYASAVEDGMGSGPEQTGANPTDVAISPNVSVEPPLRVLNLLAQGFLQSLGMLSTRAFIECSDAVLARALIDWRQEHGLKALGHATSGNHIKTWKRAVLRELAAGVPIPDQPVRPVQPESVEARRDQPESVEVRHDQPESIEAPHDLPESVDIPHDFGSRKRPLSIDDDDSVEDEDAESNNRRQQKIKEKKVAKESSKTARKNRKDTEQAVRRKQNWATKRPRIRSVPGQIEVEPAPKRCWVVVASSFSYSPR